MSNKINISYDCLLDFNKLEDVYHTIRLNTKHKKKLISFQLFKNMNFQNIYDSLSSKEYKHSDYNVFLITQPKCRLIMSEGMNDKIVNHLVSRYVLFPLIEPKLIEMNVATRAGKGTKQAIFYVKKYINKLKQNHDNVYALKCDIHKFFYSIDHGILMKKLSKIIEDKDILNLIEEIVNSTNSEKLKNIVAYQIKNQIKHIEKSNISANDKASRINELKRIPVSEKGKGLPIGNMTSQIMAVFYLNDLDHFIKEKLHVKYYVRYMDDLLLIHHDKKYLRYCLHEIEKKVQEELLFLNNKTQIYSLDKGLPFLGFKFKLKGKKLLLLLQKNTKNRIKRRFKKAKTHEEIEELKKNYNGYLINADCGSFLHNYQ